MVGDESSVYMDVASSLPPCPFINGSTEESKDTVVKRKEGSSYISDMTESTY